MFTLLIIWYISLQFIFWACFLSLLFSCIFNAILEYRVLLCKLFFGVIYENCSFKERVESCDPMDCGPPDSPVHGILQARILEWDACPPGDLPHPGIELASLMSPALAVFFLPLVPRILRNCNCWCALEFSGFWTICIMLRQGGERHWW